MREKCFFFILLITFSACEEVFIQEEAENTPLGNFGFMWNTIDEKYSFFEYKNINWDSIYTEYRPRVEQVKNDTGLFTVLAEMLNELKDGHTNLRSPFNRSRYWGWMLNYPPNFDWHLVERNYLGNDYWMSGPLYNQVIDSVGYIYYGSFASKITPGNLDSVISRFSGLKGIIIDIRDNGGGSSGNGNLMVSRFVKEKTLVSYEKYKLGPGHDDFSAPVPNYIEPGGPIQFTEKPVVILTNRHSYSAANDFPLKMIALDHVTLIGDKTGGGGGTPIYFDLPNGWSFRFSSNIRLAVEAAGLADRNVEHGIPPDIPVDIDPVDQANGIDTIIERALGFIHNSFSPPSASI